MIGAEETLIVGPPLPSATLMRWRPGGEVRGGARGASRPCRGQGDPPARTRGVLPLATDRATLGKETGRAHGCDGHRLLELPLGSDRLAGSRSEGGHHVGVALLGLLRRVEVLLRRDRDGRKRADTRGQRSAAGEARSHPHGGPAPISEPPRATVAPARDRTSG